MRFTLIDRILEIESGKRIHAVKSPTLSEEYLQDHFPRFPVMPGVLMLEAMAQAGAWLVRYTDNFAHNLILLKEARNVKYAGLVVPGQSLTILAEIQKREDDCIWLKTQGVVKDKTVISGRLVLQHFADAGDSRDGQLRRYLRDEFALLFDDGNGKTTSKK